MTVYVDQERNNFRRMVMCHMFADTLAELHTMAGRIGMSRAWFQADASFPHYDLSLTRRGLALKYGAQEITRREGYDIRKRLRADPAFMAEWMESRQALNPHSGGGS